MYAAKDLIEQCANNKMSAGKVDIVAHSMSGILSRIFLQSRERFMLVVFSSNENPPASNRVGDFASSDAFNVLFTKK